MSRPDQISACVTSVTDHFDKDEVYQLDPDASPLGDTETQANDAPVETGLSADDPGIPFEGLHAKLFVFDQGSTTTVLSGSANATSAAFTQNVEFLTEFTGPRRTLGVDALLAPKQDKGEPTLHTFLVRVALDEADGSEADAGQAEDQLDRLRRSIASVPLIARAIEEPSPDRFRLTFATTDEMPALPDGVAWRCWPITIASDAGTGLTGQAPLDQTFVVSFEGITAFLANELTYEDLSTRFVLTAQLVEAPENRTTRLLRILLGDAERFLRYLLMLLADDAVDQYGLTDLLDAIEGAEPGRWQSAPDSIPLLEALLRTLAREPARLDHIQHLITDLEADDEAPSMLPDGFLELWEPIWAAAQEARG